MARTVDLTSRPSRELPTGLHARGLCPPRDEYLSLRLMETGCTIRPARNPMGERHHPAYEVSLELLFRQTLNVSFDEAIARVTEELKKEGWSSDGYRVRATMKRSGRRIS